MYIVGRYEYVIIVKQNENRIKRKLVDKIDTKTETRI